MANEIVGVQIKVDSSQATKSLGEIRKEIKQANSELIAAQQGFGDYSAEALAAARKVATLKDSIAEAAETANLFDPGKKFQAFTGALSAVAGGFAAVQGAIGLLGVESEAVEKTILKVQSALALSQGLSTIKDSAKEFQRLGAIIQSTTAFQKINNAVTALTASVMRGLGLATDATSTSFKLLKGAIAATGIGLLVVAVGELVNAFQNYTSAAEKAKVAQDELNESQNKGAKTAFDTEVAFLEREKLLTIAKAKNRKASEKEIFEIEQSFAKSRIEAQKRFIADTRNATVEDQITAERDLKSQQNAIVVSELNFQTSQNQKKEDQRKKDADVAEALRKKTEEGLAKAKKAGQDFQKIVDDNKEKQREENEKNELKRIEDENKEVERLFALEEKKIEIATEASNRKKKIEQDIVNAQLETFLQKKSIQSAEVDLLFQLSGVLKQVAGDNKAILAAAIIAENAAGIGRIIINTQVANAKAVGVSPLTAGQPFVTLNTISGALGVASSLLATRNALRSLGSGGSVGTPQGLAARGGRPPINAELAPTSQTFTTLNPQSINQLGSATNRAFVVESDISNSQERITRINRAARLA